MRETFKKVLPGVEIRDGDAYKLPVDDASVDAIICAQVLFNSAIVLIVGIPLVRNSRGLEGVCQSSQTRRIPRLDLEPLRQGQLARLSKENLGISPCHVND
jgi:hypothetical protein